MYILWSTDKYEEAKDMIKYTIDAYKLEAHITESNNCIEDALDQYIATNVVLVHLYDIQHGTIRV